jgi:23S rRNA (adenine2030-N6)-methyltransferase
MKYQHHFHAGNFSDLVKHLVWYWTLTYLKNKPHALDIIDTHSGSGFYSILDLSEEYQEGVERFMQAPCARQSAAHCYWSLLQEYAANGLYPGSPLLAQKIKRQHDTLWLFEKQADIYQHLKTLQHQAPLTHIQCSDALRALYDLLHRPFKRIAILIDPAYERPEEYAAIAELLAAIHQKKPQASVILWYPLGKRSQLMAPIFEKQSLWADKSLNIIYEKKHQTRQTGLQSAGLLLLNPPYVIKELILSVKEDFLNNIGIDIRINTGSSF